VGDGVEEGIF